MRRRRRFLVFSFMVVVMTCTGSVAAAAEPVAIRLKVQTAAAGATQVTATVTDGRGAPVADVAVSFKARTTFGWLTLAEVTTDRTGVAAVTLQSSIRPRELAAEADIEEGTVRAAVWLVERQSIQPAVRPGRGILSRLSPQPGFISPYPVPLQVIVLTVILGGIWTTYAYVVALLVRIKRAR